MAGKTRRHWPAWMTALLLAAQASASVPHPENYAGTDGLEGPALAQTLQAISARGHRPLSYKAVWDLLEETDQDPDRPGYIKTFYSRKSVPKHCKSGKGGRRCPHVWNREHVWAKSHGFPGQRQWAYTDGHHLRAETERCNSMRGNLDFAEGGDEIERCKARRVANTSWEPTDEVKGDTARILFYMAVRYDGDPRDNTPDLDLVNHPTHTGQPQFGKVCDLLKWHRLDPVSLSEQRRNDIVERRQGNRNPFIDRPDFAERIWAASCPATAGQPATPG
ncbi:endonuclease I family protein [Paludibacterium paludis]|uniref:Extracellular ribonuclease n=1 Tax=Paludibacterium paludis TaxID=1225769 RepID=A0A918P4U9_9NEIS|nr:endonuclease [Paludibacterium paludis]GGY17763.1 extracellular ribonuclease [Paludibacterium paludis]